MDYSSYEKHPLGRTEWVKLYGTLLGKTEEAQKAFNAQKKILEEISGQENTGKTVAYFYITTNGTVNVRKSSDYVPKMIELAGGKYIFGNLGVRQQVVIGKYADGRILCHSKGCRLFNL